MATQRLSGANRYTIFNARTLYNHGNFYESVSNYLAVMSSIVPDARLQYINEFVDALKHFFDNEIDDSRVTTFLNEASVLPDLEFHIYRARSEWLFSRGDFFRSLAGFQRILSIVKNDTEWLHAVTSLENIKANFIDSVNWRIINDENRNRSFRDAIYSTMRLIRERQGRVNFIDLCCGYGLYSILANWFQNVMPFVDTSSPKFNAPKDLLLSEDWDAIRVYSCEGNITTCKIAGLCVNSNNAKNINLIASYSTILNGLNIKFDIALADMMDCGIFGNRIIDIVADAKENLLESAKQTFVIPTKVTAYFALIQSEEIALDNYCRVTRRNISKRQKFVKATPSIAQNVKTDKNLPSATQSTPSTSSFEPYKSTKPTKPKTVFKIENNPDYEQPFDDYVLLSQYCYLEKGCRTRLFSQFEPTQPYIAQYLNALQTEFVFISDPVEGLSLNFNDLQEIDYFRSNKFETVIEFTAVREGIVHAVVSWFKANLFEDICFDSSPSNDSNSYQQAVFPLYPPKFMRKGDTFLCKIYVKNNQLRVCPFTSYGPTEDQDRVIMRATTDLNLFLMQSYNITRFFKDAVKLGCFTEVLDCTDLLIYSEKSKPILNLLDIAVDELLSDLVEQNKKEKESQKDSEKNKINEPEKDLKDDSEKDSTKLIEESDCKMSSSDILSSDMDLKSSEPNLSNTSANVGSIFGENFNPRVVVCSNLPIIRHVADFSIALKDAVKYQNIHLSKKENYPTIALIYWPLSTRGLLMDGYIANVVSNFIEAEGRIQLIPAIVRLKCQLIASREIVERTRIVNVATDLNNPSTVFSREKHCGVDLTSMNEFRQNYVHDIDLYNDFEFESISDPFEMYNIRFDQIRNPKQCINELTKIREILEVPVIRSGTCTAVLHWFEFADGFGNELCLPKEITQLSDSTSTKDQSYTDDGSPNTSSDNPLLSTNSSSETSSVVTAKRVFPKRFNVLKKSKSLSFIPAELKAPVIRRSKSEKYLSSISDLFGCFNKPTSSQQPNAIQFFSTFVQNPNPDYSNTVNLGPDLFNPNQLRNNDYNESMESSDGLQGYINPAMMNIDNSISMEARILNSKGEYLSHDYVDSDQYRKRRESASRIWAKASAYVMDRPVNVLVGTVVRVEASLYHGNVVFHSVLDMQKYPYSQESFNREKLHILYEKQKKRIHRAVTPDIDQQELL